MDKVANYDFRNQKTELPVIRIDISVPIYRMENFRTFTDQTEYAVREGKPADFFRTGQENESVQQLQHEILAKLAKVGRSESVVPIIDVLKKERQREEILITHSGVVVNGNRRLAAMRELFAESPSDYSDFSHINCAVLPEDATPAEIVDIEAALQAKPETKLDYDWIGECQLINRLLDLGRKPEEIAERLNRRKKDVENMLQALAEANLYLKDWAHAEGEYSRVARDGEQFFRDLPALLAGKDPQLQEASRVIAWTLFDNRASLGDRLYAFNAAVGKRAADVLHRLSSTLEIPLSGENSRDIEAQEFDVDLDAEQAAISYEAVVAALQGSERREEVVEALIEECRGVVESERHIKSGAAALRSVTTAHSKLSEVDLTKADPATYAGIEKQLDAVLQKASALKTSLAEYLAATRSAE